MPENELLVTIRPGMVACSVPCDDIDVAASFYRRLLGKEAEEPASGNVEVELAEGVWLQLNADPAEKGQAVRVLLGVDGIDAAVAETVLAGAEVGSVETYEDVLAWAATTGQGNQGLSLVQIKG